MTDRQYQRLSAKPPSGQSLWDYFLYGQRTTIFPGVIVATEAVIASDLRWPLHPELPLLDRSSSAREGMPGSVRECWLEIEREGMAKADWRAGVVVLQKALFNSRGEPKDTAHPGSPNALKGWAKAWPDIPECDLKDEYLLTLERYCRELGKNYSTAFAKAFRAFGALPERSRSGGGSGGGIASGLASYQEQEQEQDRVPEFRSSFSPEPSMQGGGDLRHRTEPAALEDYDALKANGFRFDKVPS